MRRELSLIFICLGVAGSTLFTGCASKPQRSSVPGEKQIASEERLSPPPTSQSASLPQLQRMLPGVQFPATRPAASTQPAPLESIELYANARAALDANDLSKAAELMNRAIQLDPDSFTLRYGLAEVYAASNVVGSLALDAL